MAHLPPSRFRPLLEGLVESSQNYYGARLVSIALFGSAARGTYRADSDLDLFFVIRELPRGRTRKQGEFTAVEEGLARELKALEEQGFHAILAPVFRTPEEVEQFSPLLLDMTEEAILLFDRNHFLKNRLERMARRLKELGSKRIWKGSRWYWDLKPDYKPGEIFEL